MSDPTPTRALDGTPIYDLVIIGGGSAGYSAARTATGLGLHTVLIEGGAQVGGLCILRGCMPSKTMIESANRFIALRRAAEFGLRVDNPRVVAPEIQARKRRLVKEFSDYRRGQLEMAPFDFVRGLARFESEHRIRLEMIPGSDPLQQPPPMIEGRTFILATGSHVKEVQIEGLAETGYLTSDELLELEEFPTSVIVLGAGAIGLEAAHQLAGLGSEVTIIQRCGQIMRDADEDVAEALQKALSTQGIRFECGTQILRAEMDASTGQKRIWFLKDGVEHSCAADEIAYALGRVPCVENLELHRAGVELTKRGQITTKLDQSTTTRHIFAAGDVAGPYEIVHIAIQQGEIAARNAARLLGKLADAPEQTDYRLKLFVLFTEPQLAHVGSSEKEAIAAGRDYVVASYAFADHGKAIVRGETEGFVKLMADRATGEIIGGSAVGPEAAELIHEIVVAMYFHAHAKDLARIPHYHPTLSEIWTYPAEELSEKTSI